MLFRKLTVYLCPLLLFLLVEVILYDLKFVWPVMVLSFILIMVTVKFLVKEKLFTQSYLVFSGLSVLFFYLTLGFIFLLNSNNIKHSIALLLAIIFIFLFDNVCLYYYQPKKYQSFTLEKITAFLNIIIFFFTTINLNAFSIFLNIPIGILSVVLIIITSFLIFQLYWINKVINNYKYVYLIIIDLLVVEFFWGLFFLPTNLYINGIILTISFYLLTGFVMAKIMNKLEKKLILGYLLISCILLIIIISTSTWVY